MPAQKKPSLETISEGWQEVAPSSSSAMTPVSEQDASSSSSDSESEHPTTEHIEDIAAHAGTLSEHSADSNACKSEAGDVDSAYFAVGSSSSAGSSSCVGSTPDRANRSARTSTWGDENISNSVSAFSVRVLRVSFAPDTPDQPNSPVSGAQAESSSSVASDEAGPGSFAAADESGSAFSPTSASALISDESSTSGSEDVSIPGFHVFPMWPASGTAGRPSSPVSGVQANPGSYAAANRSAPTNEGISCSNAAQNGGINIHVVPRRPSFPNLLGLSTLPQSPEDAAVHQRLLEEREYARDRAHATYFGGGNGGIWAHRRAEEAHLAAKGYSPRDIHPDPLRSHPLDPPCTHCMGLPSTRPPQLCFPCRTWRVEQIKYDHFIPSYDNPNTRGASPGFRPIVPVRERAVGCRVIDHTAGGGDATTANGTVPTESHVSNNANNHATNNNGNGRVTANAQAGEEHAVSNTNNTAERVYQGQDDRTGVRSSNGTSENSELNYEACDEPTRSLLQSGIPIAAMLAFSDSALGDVGTDTDGDEDES